MANMRKVGLSVVTDRDESARCRREEEARYETGKLMNQWGFRTSCFNRSQAYNEPVPTEAGSDGRKRSLR